MLPAPCHRRSTGNSWEIAPELFLIGYDIVSRVPIDRRMKWHTRLLTLLKMTESDSLHRGPCLLIRGGRILLGELVSPEANEMRIN